MQNVTIFTCIYFKDKNTFSSKSPGGLKGCLILQGEKDRNIIDVHDFSLVIPTLEYHNRTWTWHDLLMAMKKDCVNVLLSQVS